MSAANELWTETCNNLRGHLRIYWMWFYFGSLNFLQIISGRSNVLMLSYGRKGRFFVKQRRVFSPHNDVHLFLPFAVHGDSDVSKRTEQITSELSPHISTRRKTFYRVGNSCVWREVLESNPCITNNCRKICPLCYYLLRSMAYFLRTQYFINLEKGV